MKNIIFFFTVLLILPIGSYAQADVDKNYWVVETNQHIPQYSVVKIYNVDNILVHEVTLNSRIDVNNKKHRKALNQILQRHAGRNINAGKKIRSKSSV